jgi:hypothetical protein
MQGVCSAPTCPVGSAGCPCTIGGACEGDLLCNAGTCFDPGETATDATESGSDDTGSTTTGESLDDWTRRRPIVVGNELSDDLSGFQVLVTVDYDDDMNVDFSDLRFTDEDGSAIPHWTEDSVSPAWAEVWVRVPSIPARGSTTVYVYYGNPMAESADDGEATFSFFDGFDDDIDATTWSVTGEASVTNGRVTIETGSVHSNALVVDTNQWVEVRTSWQNNTTEHAGFRIGTAQTHAVGFRQQDLTYVEGNMRCQVLDDAMEASLYVQLPDGVTQGAEHIFAQAVTDTANIFGRDRLGTLEHDDPWEGAMFLALGHNWGSAAGVLDGADMTIDWVIVREYATTDPTYILGSEESL